MKVLIHSIVTGLWWLLVCCPATAGDIGGPRVFNWDSKTLGDNARELRAGSERLQPALDALIGQAEKALKVEPVSVVTKTQTPAQWRQTRLHVDRDLRLAEPEYR